MFFQKAYPLLKTKKGIYLLVGMLISAIFISITIQDGHNWGGDFALYIHQGKSLVDDLSLQKFYELNKFSMQNSSKEIGPYLYPNGFPILLTPIYYLFGIDFIKMKILNALFFIFSIPLIYSLFKAYFSNYFYPLLIACLIAFNHNFITFTDSILSDLSFFFFTLLSINLIKNKNTFYSQLILGICIFYTYFIRDIGVCLIPTLFIYQLFHLKRYNKKYFLLSLPYLVFITLFITSKQIFPAGGENHYSIIFSKISLNLIKNNIDYYTYLISKFVVLNQYDVWIRVLVTLIFWVGVFSNIKKYLHFVTFIVCNLVILLIWPSVQGYRFIFPILPFIMFFLLQGILFIYSKLKIDNKYLSILLAIYFLAFSYHSFKTIIAESKEKKNQSYTAEMINIYSYISLNIPSHEIIGFQKPRVLSLFTNVNAINTDTENFDKSVAKYLLIKKELINDNKKNKIIKDFPNYVIIKK